MIDYNALLNSRAFTREQAETLIRLLQAAIAEAGGGGGASWGGITGTLTDQTDLDTALNGKEPVFSKGSLIQGAGVTLTGTLADRLVGAGDITVAAAAAADWTTVVLGTTYSTTSAGNTVVTGLAFTPAINKTYAIEGFFLLTTTLATVGARPGVQSWPTNLGTGSAARTEVPNSATASAQSNIPGGTAGLALSTGLPATGGNGYLALLDAVMRTTGTSSGDFQIGLGSETSGTSVSMLAGSYIRYREIA